MWSSTEAATATDGRPATFGALEPVDRALVDERAVDAAQARALVVGHRRPGRRERRRELGRLDHRDLVEKMASERANKGSARAHDFQGGRIVETGGSRGARGREG